MFLNLKVQDSSRFYFTTSPGLVAQVNNFASAYKTLIAFNSGIEYKINRTLFSQFVLDFNAVKYNQQYKDNNSGYLFQKTNSSIFLTGINLGKNFSPGIKAKFFASVYTGAGYLNMASQG